MHGVGGRKSVRHAADLAVDVDEDVAPLDAAFVVQERRVRLHGGDRIEHRRQDLVGDVDQPAGLFGGGLGFGDDRRDALADESHHVVEHVGVIRIDQMILVDRRAVEPARHVLPGEDRNHSGNGQPPLAPDMDNARVGVRRAQYLEMARPVDRDIHGVAGAPRDDPFAKRIGQARAAGFARDILFDRSNAAERIGDRTIAGAPAQVAFEGMGQVGALILIERGGRHDHAGGAEAALKRLRVEKGALHRMQGRDRARAPRWS